jgi:hypothetical protein
MFDGTSFPAAWFCSAVTPLTRRLLVYFHSGAYILKLWESVTQSQELGLAHAEVAENL